MADHSSCKNEFEDLLKSLPPNYPVGGIYVKGMFVPTAFFSNVCDCLAYFIDEDGQVLVVDVEKINAITFGEADRGCDC
ncbi:hypothetical protein N0O92_12485 [Alkalihalobacillus sp. MEB130]|uniref:hypothetical protein n=1 Tax=Alkalihalobacillus sp. MEB130 TaxID=2976704 RepID=UPI0028DF1A63|nr:hypothetical protein [Alkalihalobacillus sp. MEB130]MDT8861052.1 hypothetical protein [Alkalihalobacillus sp. MEB130]